MSNFTEQPKKILLAVAESLLKTNFNYKFPWDDADDNNDIFEESTSWIGIETEIEDMEFMAAFIVENEGLLQAYSKGEIPRNEVISQLTIPKPKRFEIWYEIWGPATLTEKYKTVWDSYNKNWAKESLRHSYSEGSFDHYQGEYQEYETDNFEADNFEIDFVRQLNEDKKPILDKLVVENTADVLNDLDRDTLIKLRNLINRKLGL